MFKIGDLVKCIDNSGIAIDTLKKDWVYEVTFVLPKLEYIVVYNPGFGYGRAWPANKFELYE